MKPGTLRYLSFWMVLSLVLGTAGMTAAAAPPPPPEAEEFELLEVPALPPAGGKVPFVPLSLGMALLEETEPNDTAVTANALIGTPVVIYGTITAGDYDYFSFYADAGDRVYAAPQTQWSSVSGDSRLDIMASDGVTSLEFDDDSGTFSSLASAIGGTIIPADGTYYVRVYGYSATTVITPYHLHVRVQSGTPTSEVEPNNDLGTATPLGPTGWMSGTITATTDPDMFSFTLNAGDSVFIGLDMDPDRLATNTNWNGRVGLGLFNNFLLVANDGSTTKPHAEAFFMTVKEAGTYYAYVDSTSATGLGPNARYHLSVSVYPKQVQSSCTTFTSTDVPKVLTGTVTSTIVVPATVTSSISDLNATIVLTHNLMADLDVTLIGPTAASTPLFTDIGSAATGGQTAMDIGLDDQAALPIGLFTVLSGMINQPEQPGRLAAFNGTPAAGTWTLQLADDTLNASGGILQSWSLEICGDPPAPYDLELTKTVGLEPGVCAATDSVDIPPGGFDVVYCYTVRNTGLNALATHDLVDSELGTIFTGVSYSLEPGATYSYIQEATIHATVTNTGTWTAQGVTGDSASDTDTATVTVRTQGCPAGYREVTLDYSHFDNPFPPAGWTVTNTSSGCTPPGVPEWTNTNPGNRVNLTGGVGPFAIADSDRCGSGSTLDTIMATGSLDFTGLMSPTVSFNTDYYDIGTGGDQALVDLSTDGGATWTNLFTWDASHRGPLLITQPLTGAADMANVQVRWHYSQGTYDWWWQVDSAFITACAPPLEPAIALNKTVGTTPGVCATTDDVTVVAGTEVYYCYQVENTGSVTLNFHDLVDSELGVILDDLPYTLAPGAFSPQVIVPETPLFSVTNVATWTAVTALGAYMVDDTIPFDWQDISSTGTAVPLTDDSVSDAIPVGFAFNYFDVDYSDIYISSNGFLSALAGQGSGCCTGGILPNTTIPNGVIAGWWEDLNLSGGGTVHYQTLGVAPDRTFIVQFTDVPHYAEGNLVTLQYKLFEGTNVIEVHYQAAPSDGGTHSAGIENADGTAGVQYYRGTESLITPLAVRYAPEQVLSASAIDSATVTVLRPNIDVDPLSMSSTQAPDTTTSQLLTVANTGEGDLVWTIVEEPVAKAPAMLQGGDASVARDTVSPSDFKAQPQAVMTAPRSDWYIEGVVLYDNGPLVTHPGGGAGGADVSALQAAIGLNTYGFGNQVSAGNRVADDFTVTGGGWFIQTITFFGYQTGSSTASTFTALNLRIWDGPPNDPGSSVVFGDTTTNRLASSTWTNIYRVLDTALADSTRPVMANEVTVNTFLPAGTYWLDWQADGTLASGPWAPPISILGQTDTGNAWQYTSTGWAALVDGTFPQGLPFVIEGTSDCSNPSDVPWLSTSPSGGTNAAGTSTPVTVGFDSTGLAIGTYEARLCIASNDPDLGPGNGTGLVIVPVTLEVTQIVTPSIVLTKTVGTVPGVCATTNDITVPEGTEVYYCYQIQNTGNVTFMLHDLVDTELGTLVSALPYELAPGALSPQVIVPATLFVTTVNTATWTAYVVGGPTATATDMARVVVTPSAVSVTGLRASASGSWSVALLGAFALGGFAWRRKRR